MCPFILLVSILRFPLIFAITRCNPRVMTVAHKQVWSVLGGGRILQWQRNTSLYECRILFLVNFLTHYSTVIITKQRTPKDWWVQITRPSLASHMIFSTPTIPVQPLTFLLTKWDIFLLIFVNIFMFIFKNKIPLGEEFWYSSNCAICKDRVPKF